MNFSLLRVAMIIGLMSLTYLPLKAQIVQIQSTQVPLDTILNSASFEENPVLSRDGRSLFFTRSGHADNMGGIVDEGDIWFAEHDGNSWSAPINLGRPLNDEGRNSVIGLLNDETLLLTSQYPGSAKDNGFAVSKNSGGAWGKPQNIDLPYFKSLSDYKSATISPDGTTIIFSLMSFGSYGVEDLYFSRLNPNGTWSDLRNLGSKINTRYQELTPFISADGETIYFASNGRNGYGGLDIYRSTRLDDTWRNWSEPENLGSEVNTNGAETGFSFAYPLNWAVMVSTQNSDGYGDLKRVDIAYPDEEVINVDTADQVVAFQVPEQAPPQNEKEPLASYNFKGMIKNSKTLEPIEGTIELISEIDTLQFNSTTEGFTVVLPEADYQLLVKAVDYLEYDSAFTITASSIVEKDFRLEPLEVGNTITLKHVLFERGTTNLITGSEQDLEAVFHMMRDNPSIEINIAGHTDNQGSFKLNVKLSQERVDKVIDYLIDRGISKRRLTGKGWGPMKPIASNVMEETRRLNRRVEFTITKK